jgi:hypothetical protein
MELMTMHALNSNPVLILLHATKHLRGLNRTLVLSDTSLSSRRADSRDFRIIALFFGAIRARGVSLMSVCRGTAIHGDSS